MTAKVAFPDNLPLPFESKFYGFSQPPDKLQLFRELILPLVSRGTLHNPFVNFVAKHATLAINFHLIDFNFVEVSSKYFLSSPLLLFHSNSFLFLLFTLEYTHHVSRWYYSLRDWLQPRHACSRPRLRIRTVCPIILVGESIDRPTDAVSDVTCLLLVLTLRPDLASSFSASFESSIRLLVYAYAFLALRIHFSIPSISIERSYSVKNLDPSSHVPRPPNHRDGNSKTLALDANIIYHILSYNIIGKVLHSWRDC